MQQAPAPVPVAPGDILAGKYRIERVLGMGGMGVVVAARHLDLGELFAIKFLLPQALTNMQAVDRFLREARAAARLKGEHVAKVTDVGRLENGSPYMVMEHLSGTDLQKHVRMYGALPADVAVTYLLQTCDAIAEAHGAGIVHRDIKPANLFLTQRPNGTPCVKVLDFGISKQTSPEAVDLTKTGMALGSPLYMAPEQMARTKDADPRCDIWSLGIVLYELVTGTVPFYAETITEVVARVLQEEAAPPSRVRNGVPPALDAVIAKCLQKKPEHRFQSIQELIAALRNISQPASLSSTVALDSPLMLPSIPGPGATTGPGAITGPGAVTGPGNTGSSLGPSNTGSSLGAPAAPATTASANTASAWGTTGGVPAPKKSSLPLVLALSGVLVAGLAAAGIYFFALRSPSGGADASAAADSTGAASVPIVVPSPSEPPAAPQPTAPASAPEPAASTAAPPPSTTAAPPPSTAAAAPKSATPSQPASPAKTPAKTSTPAASSTGTKKTKREGVW